ncbi:unnamed protein product [Ilex paraguariensis]|uniref:Transcription factor UPBEAT1 n=1 Tax=Ilex paraguariensis TaxID=185542 RepID=A0ABC8SCV2_9AQUA
MGGSPKQLLDVLDILTKRRCNSTNPSWSKVLEVQAKRRWLMKKQRVMTSRIRGHINGKRVRKIAMKRRGCSQNGSRRPRSAVEKKVKTLKKLIPDGESMGLDGLFRETADYILSLQMRVRVMQIMVKVLSDSDE